MRIRIWASVATAATLLAALASPAAATRPAESGTVYVYPAATPGPQVDTYFGTQVADPYRWLEDSGSAQTQAWVQGERSLAAAYLGSLPSRAARAKQITDLITYSRSGTPVQVGRALFWLTTAAGADQPVLFWSKTATSKPIALLDGNRLSKDGTAALSDFQPSWNAKYVAYSVSRNGSDWVSIKVRSVATKQDLDDRVDWAKFTAIAWSPDNSGFYYSGYTKPKNPLASENKNHRLYFHRLGTPQSADRIVYEDPKHPLRTVSGSVDDRARMLWIYTNDSANSDNRLYYQKLDRPGQPVTSVFTTGDAEYYPIAQRGDHVWMQTTHGAPNRKIVDFSLARPSASHWKTVVAQTPIALDSASAVGDRLVAVYLVNAVSSVRLFDLAGHAKGQADLPGLGTASGFAGDDRGSTTYYTFSSFTSPSMVMRLNVRNGRSSVWKKAVTGLDSSLLTTDQVFVTSKDGTKVPAFVVHRKDAVLDGSNPTILTGYGGFGVSLSPSYSTFIASWLQSGGVYVEANLRGGGEYGQAWSDAGNLFKKQNVFDDFIAVAQWLIDNKWTSTKHLAIKGESNGGLLVGAAMTQRPDLFGAALPGVGVLDMLRYQNFTIGSAWVGEYGSSADSAEMFHYLLGYSPLHNVRPGVTYPPTLITTGDHDDRVVPAHSYKFAATLQADNAGTDPIIIRIDTNAGHGGGAALSQLIDEWTDQLAFLDSSIGNQPVVPTPVFTRAA